MDRFLNRFVSLIFGLFLYGLGIVLTLKANIGYAPWDVFHAGIVNITHISFGSVSIIVGLFIIVLALLLGEKVGIGTILNMFLIGVFIDLLLRLNIANAPNLVIGFIIQALGLFTIAIGSYYYIRAGFGTGPRDSLMVAINRRTGISIGLSRGVVQFCAAIVGYFLGGLLGVGTLFSALVISTFVQFVFRIYRFDPTEVKHETIMDTLRNLV